MSSCLQVNIVSQIDGLQVFLRKIQPDFVLIAKDSLFDNHLKISYGIVCDVSEDYCIIDLNGVTLLDANNKRLLISVK